MIRYLVNPAALLDQLGVDPVVIDGDPDAMNRENLSIARALARTLQRNWPLTDPAEALAVKFDLDTDGTVEPGTERYTGALAEAIQAAAATMSVDEGGDGQP